MEMQNVADKVVIITGASGGIGAGTAAEFAMHGAKLVISGRNLEKLQYTKQLCLDAGLADDKIALVTADVTKEEDLDKIVDTAVQTFGTIDILVNNAGIPMIGDIETLKIEDYDNVMSVNVRSVFVLTQKCVPHIVANKGHIINVSSSAGIRANPVMTVYCMSKRAIDFLTKSLALELGPKGVHVNSVNPSTVEDTIIWTREGAGISHDKLPEYYDTLRKGVPIGRLCQVKDVATAIVFLVSHRCSFVTGYNLPLDGGYRNKTGRNVKTDPRNVLKKD